MITKEYLVFLDRATLIADLRIPAFDHAWIEHPNCAPEEAAELLWRASIAITNKVPITRAVLEACPKLRLIAVAATGTNNVDLDACRERGVAVCNIRGYAQHTVPEHVFMLLLALRRNLLAWRVSLQNDAWQKAEQFCLFDHEIHDLHGSTLGLIGYGSVGVGVEHLARAFGMQVLIAERKGAAEVRPGLRRAAKRPVPAAGVCSAVGALARIRSAGRPGQERGELQWGGLEQGVWWLD